MRSPGLRLITALAVFTTYSAIAADSVEVKVIGTIVPAACTPSIVGGATIDYGTIKSSTLTADNYTLLPVKHLDLAITCDAPAKVALSLMVGAIIRVGLCHSGRVKLSTTNMIQGG